MGTRVLLALLPQLEPKSAPIRAGRKPTITTHGGLHERLYSQPVLDSRSRAIKKILVQTNEVLIYQEQHPFALELLYPMLDHLTA